jgi:GNAT superfamily N-acetyltransferase
MSDAQAVAQEAEEKISVPPVMAGYTYFADFETRPLMRASITLSEAPWFKWVHLLQVPLGHRRKGIATALLKRAIADADEHGWTLRVEPEQYGDDPGNEMPTEALKAWYRRFGFRHVDEYGPDCFIMERRPGAKELRNSGRGRVSTGMPTSLYLDQFGSYVWDLFGFPPYLVGSALCRTDYRDVDIRLILSDEQYEAWALGHPHDPHRNARWVSLVLAYSALGTQMIGLPIDFQIQQQTFANKRFSREDGHNRSCIGMVPARFKE